MSDVVKNTEPDLVGWLYKWTNYLKGYQKRWFVLSNGLLSYYRVETKRSKSMRIPFRRKRRKSEARENQAEMRHTCRGSVSLQNAIISTTDPCSFIISNGANQTFHIRAANEKDRQTWLTALTLAKSNRIHESEEEEEYPEGSTINHKQELANLIKALSQKLEEVQTCNDVIPKHWTALNRSLTELENLELGHHENYSFIKELQERATLFRITSGALVNKCTEFNEFAQNQGKKWIKILKHEREQRERLEQMVEQLARQHSHLEEAAKDHQQNPRPNKQRNSSISDDEDDNEFYDANYFEDETDKTDFTLNMPFSHRRTESGMSQNSQGDPSGSSSEAEEVPETHSNKKVVVSQMSAVNTTDRIVTANPGCRVRRTRVPDKPDYPLNLWSIMKNCIGKELSKIPMPVNFSEPLSMLQRLTEDFEYAHILDKAATCSDSCEQLAYVAAFTVSSYATTAVRTAKPFNPLLGETYECDRRDDLGWRSISEQVSHHPPMFAQHCEGSKWTSWQEFTMASKFRGKYLQVIPLGISHLTFAGTGNHYTWRKVTTTVHNIIFGRLWVDQHGEMDIVNHGNGDVCHLKYYAWSYFERDSQRKVKGWVKNKAGEVKWVITGRWDRKIEIAPVTASSGSPDNPIYTPGNFTLAWEVNPTRPEAEKYYNFSLLACQLNEPEEGVAPSDSRLRPDQRLMEEGRWDEANNHKIRLEEKQRAARRKREAEVEEATRRGESLPMHSPVWFTKEGDSVTGGQMYIYNNQYWECKERQDWSRCPDIF